MADFKVSVERIVKLPHPKEEGEFLISAGDHMMGLDTGLYEEGDLVVVAPKRSILPEVFAKDFIDPETGLSKLREGNVVSQRGVALNKESVVHLLFCDGMLTVDSTVDGLLAPLEGGDLSERLGIGEYTGSIPVELLGDADPLRHREAIRHDVYAAGVMLRHLVEEEVVLVTEKIHGSQLNIICHADGFVELGLKSLLKKGLSIRAESNLIYGKAFRNSGLRAIKDSLFPGKAVQFVTEVIPAQKGFTYGQSEDEPSLRVFMLIVEGEIVPLSQFYADPEYAALVALWVPFMWTSYNFDTVEGLSKGVEGVSGQGLHIKEGVVVMPDIPRKDRRGRLIIAKFLNPAYTEKDSDPS